MPLTDKECPNCGGVLHTDDLLERECVTPGCGHELPAELYDDVKDCYTPQSVTVFSEEALEFDTMFLLGQSDHEEAVEHPWNEETSDEHELDDYQRMHVLDWDTGEAFCGDVAAEPDDDDTLEVTELMGANSLNMVGVCDDCMDALMEDDDE